MRRRFLAALLVLSFIAPFAPTSSPSAAAASGETLFVPFTTPRPGLQTSQSYVGPITVTVSGTGQGFGTQDADAFYIYDDGAGDPIVPFHPIPQPPFPQGDNVNATLIINGSISDVYVQPIPSYRSDHTYTFTMNAPGGRLTFGIGDYNMADNTGAFTITIGGTSAKTLNVPLLKQGIYPFNDNNPSWEALEYDNGNSQSLGCGKTIAECGCALTSIAMVLSFHGATKSPDGRVTDPASVNDYFKRGQKCTASGCTSVGYSYGAVVWTAVGNYSKDANAIYGTQKIVWNGNGPFSAATVRQDIDGNNPVILGVPNHWVVGTGYTGNTFTINDPLFSRTMLDDPAYGNTAIQGIRRYIKTNSDYSSIEIKALAPAQILITDQNGDQTGFNPSTSSSVQNIPNSAYFFEETLADDSGVKPSPPSGAGVYTAVISIPQSGAYTIQVIAPPNAGYSFAAYANDHDAKQWFNLFEGRTSPGTQPSYTFAYNPTPGATNFALQVPIDIKPGSFPNSINLGSNGTVPVAILSTVTFDATKVDPTTVTLAGASVAVKGKGDAMASVQDVNGDGRLDLLVHVTTKALQLTHTDTQAILNAKTIDGTFIRGSDTIKVVP